MQLHIVSRRQSGSTKNRSHTVPDPDKKTKDIFSHAKTPFPTLAALPRSRGGTVHEVRPRGPPPLRGRRSWTAQCRASQFELLIQVRVALGLGQHCYGEQQHRKSDSHRRAKAALCFVNVERPRTPDRPTENLVAAALARRFAHPQQQLLFDDSAPGLRLKFNEI